MRWILSTVFAAAGACTGGQTEGAHAAGSPGDPVRGNQIVLSIGCAACHTIPRIRYPRGEVGPSLDRFALRTYIAGVVPNTAENLTHWVMHPQAIEPRTAMPDLGLTQAQAEDVVAFLYTLD
jgi:cytochrome c1